jgi:hypothetical protein
MEHARNQGQELYEKARARSLRELERRPLTWLAAAAGAGALAMLILRRK